MMQAFQFQASYAGKWCMNNRGWGGQNKPKKKKI
jgi:hypothetical protein